MHTNQKTLILTKLAVFTAIIAVLAVTPLGYLPLGVVRTTTVHIPVIVGAILLGPLAGGILGGVFGLTSLINNTMNPTITSFVFTPFYSLGSFSGGFWSIVVCFVPRILIGVVAGYLFVYLKKTSLQDYIVLPIIGFIGSITNTVFVMVGIYLFFGERYAAAKSISYDKLFSVLLGIVAINGVPEAIVASVLTLAIAKPLIKMKQF